MPAASPVGDRDALDRTLVALRPGDPVQLGPWQLQAKLGAGGMGVVYLGADGDRRAAVKTMWPHWAALPEFRDRFLREVAALRAVRGPQLASLYEADLQAAVPWLATQFVPGPTLEQAIVEHGRLPSGALHAFAIALLEAVRQIHAAGITHRDLKPSNVILTPESPVVIDFGIARLMNGTAHTSPGQVAFSAGWSAPEIVTGRECGPASDLFSWAALVAYAGTGRPPFPETPGVPGCARVLGPPDLRGLDPVVLPVVLAALARDADQRPTPAELVRGLSSTNAPTQAADTIAESWAIDTWVLTKIAPHAEGRVRLTHVPPSARRPVAAPPRGWRGEAHLDGEGRARVAPFAVTGIVMLVVIVVALAGIALVTALSRPPAVVYPPAHPQARAASEPTLAPIPEPAASASPQLVKVVRVPAKSHPPTLHMTVDSSSHGIDRLVAFVRAHGQELVVLDLDFVPHGLDIDARPVGDNYRVLLRASRDLACGPACEVVLHIANVSRDPDAVVTTAGNLGTLTGRFVVQSDHLSVDGTTHVNLRAVPVAPYAPASPSPSPHLAAKGPASFPTPAPAATSSPAPVRTDDRAGYGAVRLGMSRAELMATGAAAPAEVTPSGNCRQFSLDYGGRALVSRMQGRVVAIEHGGSMKTSRNIGLHSTKNDLINAYPDIHFGWYGPGTADARVNANAYYVFELQRHVDEAHVTDITLWSETADCG